MTSPTSSDWRNKLHFGDNLPILRDNLPAESVDLIYLDPPFNSNAAPSPILAGCCKGKLAHERLS